MASYDVIVVGGGLSGLSSAHSVLQSGLRVLLIDKNPLLGGNSTKATSGINGAETLTQKKLGIPDTKEIFEEDTIRGGTGVKTGPCPPSFELGRVLTHESGAAVNWLIEKFDLQLDAVSRLGGHSQPRTHRSKTGGKFPGMMITYRLMERFDEICKAEPSRAKLIIKAKVNKLLTDASGKVTGVQYEKDGQQVHVNAGAVIIASGGYAAGGLFANSILQRVRPDLMSLPTTNGEHCTGDGIVMSEEIGAASVDMEFVQVHPTGLVHPLDPNGKVKFLAAEALRGEGAIILNGKGERFCNEVGTRDYVSGCMMKNHGPFRLLMNSSSVKAIEWHCRHYVGRGVMKAYKTAADLAKDMGVPAANLQKTFEEYNQAAISKKDVYGRQFFDHAPMRMDDSYHVAWITPVVHYSMGGVKINGAGEVLTKEDKVIKGLYAAGEVTGGVHLKNRLGGSALLECVVFGRVSGRSAADFARSSVPAAAASAGTTVTITIAPGGQTTISVTGGNAAAVAAAPAQAAATATQPAKEAAPTPAPAAAAAASKLKEYTLEEVAKHNKESDCWVAVNGKVLDVTKFMHDHPGGKMALMTFAGKDASEEFNMLHEANVVDKYAPETIVGVYIGVAHSKL